MRRLNFRVWDGKEMLDENSKIGWGKKFYMTLEGELFIHYGIDEIFIGEDYPVMQFAGLWDKRGVEIYEGDIVRAETHEPEYYEIKFLSGAFCATHPSIHGYPIDINHFYPSVGCQIEVVGNIYQHPHLIKPLEEDKNHGAF